MEFLRSILTVSFFTLISRILGFIRDILIASILGTGFLADAFFVAFKFPNLFRRLFAEGAFNAAFIPQFSDILKKRGKRAAVLFCEHVLAVLLWSLLVFVLAIEITMPYAMLGFAPGFYVNKEQYDLVVLLTRLTFPYLLFISLVSLMSGVLNSLGKFAAAAATPILLNICLIGAVMFLADFTNTPAHALAWGVSIGGMVQFFWLLANCGFQGFHLHLRMPKLTPNVKKMLRRIIPGALGAGVYQISLLIDTIIASFLPSGSISYLFFADRVNQLPLGIVGVAVGTALLPRISRQLSINDQKGAFSTQNRAIEISMFLTVPAAIALIILSEPIISVLFERGEFGVSSVIATGGTLAIYAMGLPAYVLVKSLAPGYFARGDVSTPVKIAVLSLFLNLVLNLILMHPYLHYGIAIATAVSAWFNALILYLVAKRRGDIILDSRFKIRVPKMISASLVMGMALYCCNRLVDLFVPEEPVSKVISMVVLILIGLICYFTVSILFGAVTRYDIKDMFSRKAT